MNAEVRLTDAECRSLGIAWFGSRFPEDMIEAVEAIVAARMASVKAALERVRAIHTQDASLLAPGKWCPACGDETPCATFKATIAPPEYLGHLSREELSARALAYDEAEETVQRQRESAALRLSRDEATHGLNHAPLPHGALLDPGFCAGCDDLRAVLGSDAHTEQKETGRGFLDCKAEGPREATSPCVRLHGHDGEHLDNTGGSWPVDAHTEQKGTGE